MVVRARVAPGRWPAGPPPAPGRTLPEVWVGQWAARPGNAVLQDGWDRTRIVDGAALDRNTARLASALAAHDVGPGDRVLWSARGTLASVQALLGGCGPPRCSLRSARRPVPPRWPTW